MPDLERACPPGKRAIEDYGIRMMNLTMGNPYATTHVTTRPFDMGKYEPDEHPFAGWYYV